MGSPLGRCRDRGPRRAGADSTQERRSYDRGRTGSWRGYLRRPPPPPTLSENVVRVWIRRSARPAGDQSERMAMAGRMADAIAHRGPDDRGVWADAHGRHRAGLPPARDHRPVAVGPPADGLARAGASSSRSTARSTTSRTSAPSSRPSARTFRGTSDTEVMLAGVRAVGAGGDVPAAVGHVRDRAVGSAGAHALDRARSAGQEAAVLRLARRRRSCSALN